MSVTPPDFILVCVGPKHTTRRPAPVLRRTGESVLALPLAHSGPGDEPRARRVGPRLLDLVIGQVLGHHATGACTERYLSKTASTIEPRPFFFRKKNPQIGNCHLGSTNFSLSWLIWFQNWSLLFYLSYLAQIDLAFCLASNFDFGGRLKATSGK